MRLEVTRKSDLAVRALRILGRTDGRIKGSDLAKRLDTTPGFLSQVMNPLVVAGWVKSDPGPTGGYLVSADMSAVSLLQVIEAVEGPTVSGRCVSVDGPCDENDRCSLHDPWIRARGLLLAELDSTGVLDT